jgi:hypothetical protein
MGVILEDFGDPLHLLSYCCAGFNMEFFNPGFLYIHVILITQ